MKKFLAVILVVVILCLLSVCNEDVDVVSGFVMIRAVGSFGGYSTYLVYDPDTKVEYLMTHGFNELSFCPYYDENGNVVIYKGE